MITGVLGLTVSLLFISSCSSSRDSSQSFEVITEEGVQTSITRGGPRYTQELFSYEYVLELYEGNNEEAQLYRPGRFVRDEDGYYYVMDVGNNRIAVFSPEGMYVRQIGRKGSGPGEFRGGTIKYLHDGLLIVYDLIQQRTTRYRTDGELLDVTRLPARISMGMLAFARVESDCTIFAELGGNREGRIEMWVEFGGINADGDTLWAGQTDACEVGMMESVEFQGQAFPQPRLYQLASAPTAKYHPVIGLVVSDGIRSQLEIYNEIGAVVRRVRLVLQPEPVTSEEQDWVRAQFEENLESTPEAFKPMLLKTIQNLKFAEIKGFWDQILLDDQGWIWLRIPEPTKLTESLDAGPKYRVISPIGEYLGDTRLPKGSRVTLSGGYLMANEGDLNGEGVRLVVYQLRSAVPGFRFP